MISALLALSLSQVAPAANPALAAVYRPQRLAVILQDLSQKTGTALTADARLAELVMAIHAPGVNATDLLKQIADATLSEWIKQEDGLRLRIVRSKETAAARKYEARRVAAMRKDLAESAKEIKPFDPAVASQAQAELFQMYETENGYDQKRAEELGKILSSMSPNGQLKVDFLPLLDQGQLVRLRQGDRIVFSTHPTRMQFGLNRAALGLLERFASNNEKLNEATGGGYVDEIPIDAPTVAPGSEPAEAPEGNVPPPIKFGPMERVLAVATVSGSETSERINIQISGFDPKGLLKTVTTISVPLEKEFEAFFEPGEETGKPPVQSKVEWTERDAAFRERLAMFTGDEALFTTSADEKLRKFMIDPVVYEPIDSMLGTALMTMLKDTSKPTIWIIPDQLAAQTLMQSGIPDLAYPESIRRVFVPERLNFEEIEEGGWKVHRPIAWSGENLWTDRMAFRTGMQVLDRASVTPSLADRIVMNEMMRFEEGLSLPTLYGFLMSPGVLMNSMGFEDSGGTFMKVVESVRGSISAQIGEQGLVVPYGKLSQPARVAIEELLYQKGISNRVQRMGRMEAEGGETSISPYFLEPTVSFPAGVPNDTLVRIQRTSESAYHVQMRGWSLTMSLDELASMMAYGEENSQVLGLLPVQRDTYSVTITFAPEYERSGIVRDIRAVSGAKAMKLEELPADVKKKLDDLISAAKKQVEEEMHNHRRHAGSGDGDGL